MIFALILFVTMANNQSPTLAPSKDAEAEVRLENTSIQRSEAAPPLQTTQEEDLSELGSTSFSFAVERKKERDPATQHKLKTQLRPEIEKSCDANASKSNARALKSAGAKGGFSLRGQSLLDRYVALLAKILKFIERVALGMFRRNKALPTSSKLNVPKSGPDDYFTAAGHLNRKRKLPENKGPHLG